MALTPATSTPSFSVYPTYAPSPTPSFTCPDCFFGATSATLHSFPYTFVATITEHVFPIVEIYPNGTVCTEYSTSTEFPTVTDPQLLNGPTFSDESQMTWTFANYSMAYPNTYVQYLGFERDSFTATPAIIDGASVCTGSMSTTAVHLPPQTTAASFIFPLTATPSTTTSDNTLYFSVPVAPQLVEYLEGLSEDPACLGLESIKQCAALQTSYVNFRGPIDAPTLTLCDTTYSTITSTSPCGCSTSSPPSVTTILHCSFVKQQHVPNKAANPDLGGEEAMRPATTIEQQREPPITSFTITVSGSSTSQTSSNTTRRSLNSTSSWTSSTRSRNSGSFFPTASEPGRTGPTLSQQK